jgi:hypothetical protein
MASKYESEARMAHRLLKKYGANFTLRRVSSGGFNPSKGVPDDGSETTATLRAVIKPAPKDPNQSFEANTLIQENHRLMIVARIGLALEPQAKDEVYAEGHWWTVLGCTRLAPDGEEAIIYRVPLKR